MDTSSAPHTQDRLSEIELLLEINEHHIIGGFRRQCHRFAPEAFADAELYGDLYNEAIAEYYRRLAGLKQLPHSPADWLHAYSDEALLRAKEIVWSGSDHDHEGDDFEPAIQRPDRIRHSKRIIDLFASALADHPNSYDRTVQAVEIIIHLRYHAGGSGVVGADRFPYDVIIRRFSTKHLPIDRAFIDWTVQVISDAKPQWTEDNIFGPLDSRRDGHTLGDRTHVVAETESCDSTETVEEAVEAEWIAEAVMPDLSAAIDAARRGTPVDEVVAQLIKAAPWIAKASHDVIGRIGAVLRDFGTKAA